MRGHQGAPADPVAVDRRRPAGATSCTPPRRQRPGAYPRPCTPPAWRSNRRYTSTGWAPLESHPTVGEHVRHAPFIPRARAALSLARTASACTSPASAAATRCSSGSPLLGRDPHQHAVVVQGQPLLEMRGEEALHRGLGQLPATQPRGQRHEAMSVERRARHRTVEVELHSVGGGDLGHPRGHGSASLDAPAVPVPQVLRHRHAPPGVAPARARGPAPAARPSPACPACRNRLAQPVLGDEAPGADQVRPDLDDQLPGGLLPSPPAPTSPDSGRAPAGGRRAAPSRADQGPRGARAETGAGRSEPPVGDVGRPNSVQATVPGRCASYIMPGPGVDAGVGRGASRRRRGPRAAGR